jgi:hypothetical protein
MTSAASRIPPEFVQAIHAGTISDEKFVKLNSLLSPELTARFFTPLPPATQGAGKIEYQFNFTALLQDIATTLHINPDAKPLRPNNLMAMGTIAVNRIREKEVPVYFLRIAESKAVELLLLGRASDTHPGVIIGIYLNGVPDPDCPDPLADSSYVLLDINDHFTIKDNHIVASDFDYIKCLLESDDRFCSDEEWQPRNVNILGEPFLIELSPCWYNMWKRAFETGSYDTSDLQDFESQKGLTAFQFFNLSNTIEFSVHFQFDPRFLLDDWTIEDEIVDATTGEQRKFLNFGNGNHVDIRNFSKDISSAEVRTRIQRLRLSRRSPVVASVLPARPVTQPQARCCISSPFANGSGVIMYDGTAYNITQKIAWDEIEKMIAARGEFVECRSKLKGYFKKEALSFFNDAITAEGSGRSGTGRYKIQF